MNITDILLLLILLFSVVGGFRRGFLQGLFHLLGWMASLVLTFYFYHYVLNWIDGDGGYKNVWSVPLAFFLTFFVLRIVIGRLLLWALGAIPQEAHKSLLNRTLGIFPGLLSGLIVAALLATFLLVVPLSAPITKNAQDSWLAQRLSDPVAIVEDKIAPFLDETVQKTIGRITVDPESNTFVKLSYTVAEPKARPDLEKNMLKLLNEERIKKGLQPLAEDEEMKVVAREHSRDMFVRGYFSHYTPDKKDPFDRMREHHVRFRTAGENLALARTVLMAHEGLMNSPGHRANILQPAFKRVGIGIMDGGIYGIMVTQDFRN